MAITHADEPGNCPEPSTTPYMGGFCAFNFTSGPATGKFCWDRQPEYSAYRESSFGHGIFEVPNNPLIILLDCIGMYAPNALFTLVKIYGKPRRILGVDKQ